MHFTDNATKLCCWGCTRTPSKNSKITFLKFPNWSRKSSLGVGAFHCTTWSDFSSPSGLVCSAHFHPDCQDPSSLLKQQGFKTVFKLKDGAVPTLKSPNLTEISRPIRSGTWSGSGHRWSVPEEGKRQGRPPINSSWT